MDPLSLLCELYADGRTTVEKLRSKGVSSLQGLAQKDAQELARVLKVSVRTAKKLLAEAQDMLQGSLLEPQIVDHAAPSPRHRDVGGQAWPSAPRRVERKDMKTSEVEILSPNKQDQSFKSQVLDLVAQRFR